METEHQEFDLAVVGAGMAGMAAALFAANRGLTVVQVGGSGGILFASGFLDLLGVHPMEESKCWDDPWKGIDALCRDLPRHPYARMEKEDIRASMDEFLRFLHEADLPYTTHDGKNARMLTPLGTLKRTYGFPGTMRNGVLALEERKPSLIIDFQGLKEFNAAQIVETLHSEWPGLRSRRISFPGTEHMSRVYTRHMAQNLELGPVLDDLMERVRPLVKDAEAVGMPAVFGTLRTHEIASRFEDGIGVPLFEIPTLPASVPGFRLKEAFESSLPLRGVRTLYQSQIQRIRQEPDESFVLQVGDRRQDHSIRSRGVILATGRFFGKGLISDRQRIREALLDLPVHQPENRTRWHHRDLLSPGGHEVNLAGLETDDSFRPLNKYSQPAFPMLFATGSILAHQDWVRMKCGSGLSIATSYAAVKAFSHLQR